MEQIPDEVKIRAVDYDLGTDNRSVAVAYAMGVMGEREEGYRFTEWSAAFSYNKIKGTWTVNNSEIPTEELHKKYEGWKSNIKKVQ